MPARRSREPLRTCVGCRRVRAKRELVRIVRGPGGVLADRVGAGRGAYVCPDAGCLEHARPRLGGALRMGNIDFTTLDDHLTSDERLVV